MLFSTTPLVLALFPLIGTPGSAWGHPPAQSSGAGGHHLHAQYQPDVDGLEPERVDLVDGVVAHHATHLMGVWDGGDLVADRDGCDRLAMGQRSAPLGDPADDPDQHPMFLLQLSFLVVGAAFGMVVRRAHEGFERTIANQQAQLTHRARELADALMRYNSRACSARRCLPN